MTTDDIRSELEDMGFAGLGTRVRSRNMGDGVLSTAGNGGWGITYDLDGDRGDGQGTYQEHTRERFLTLVRAGRIVIVGAP